MKGRPGSDILKRNDSQRVKSDEVRRALANRIIELPVRFLATTSISPNALTWFGFLLAVGTAILITSGRLLAAGFLVLISGLFDLLDGALARRTNRVTRFGGILDSILDRLSEAVLLLGILGLFLLTGDQPFLFTSLNQEWSILFVFLTLLGSQLISYIRARAEAAGIDCQVGLFTRAERVIVLVLGLFLNQLIIALAIITAFSFITAAQRLLYIGQQTKN